MKNASNLKQNQSVIYKFQKDTFTVKNISGKTITIVGTDNTEIETEIENIFPDNQYTRETTNNIRESFDSIEKFLMDVNANPEIKEMFQSYWEKICESGPQENQVPYFNFGCFVVQVQKGISIIKELKVDEIPFFLEKN